MSIAAALAFGRVFADGGFVGPAARRRGRPARDRLRRARAALAARAHRRARRRRHRPRARLDQRGRGDLLRHPDAGDDRHAGRPSPRPRLVGVPHRHRAGAADARRRAALRARGRHRRARRRHDRAPTRRHDRRARSDAGALRAHRHARHRRPPGRRPRSPTSPPRWWSSPSPTPPRVEAHRTWFTGRRLASDASVVRSAAAVGRRRAPRRAGRHAARPRRRQRAGAALPQLVGAASRGFGDYEGVSPLVDLRARLSERSNIELFRVDSDVALYWRLIALDRFDGTTWSLASEAKDAAEVFGNDTPDGTVRQQFTISSLADQWMPAAFRARRTRPSATPGRSPESATLIAPTSVSGPRATRCGRSSSGHRPPARSRPPTDRSRRRAATTSRSPTRSPTRAAARRSRSPGRARRRGTRRSRSQQFFTDGSFTYDLDVRPGDGPSAIDDFLTTRRGFCQQFAAAYAALARGVGAARAAWSSASRPARYDAGADEYVVRGRDAHAWAEVWFAGLGWRTFEPTPAGPAPGQADARGTGADHAARGHGHARRRPPTTAPTSATTDGGGSTGRATRVPRPGNLVTAGSASAAGGGWSAKTHRDRRAARRRRRRRRGVRDPTAGPAAPRPPAPPRGAGPRVADHRRVAGRARRVPRRGAAGVRRADPGRTGAVTRRRAVHRRTRSRRSTSSPSCTPSSSTPLTRPQPDASDRAWHAADDVRGALLVGVGTGERVRRALRIARRPTRTSPRPDARRP